MKKYIIGFVLGAIIFGSVGSVIAYNYNAKDVSYIPSDNTWDVNSVEDAIKDLKDNKKIEFDLLWANPNPNVSFSAQKITMDLSAYKYIIITIKTNTSLDYFPRGNSIISIGSDRKSHVGVTGGSMYRTVTTDMSGVTISGCSNNDQAYAIPYKIYGIKDNLGLDLGVGD